MKSAHILAFFLTTVSVSAVEAVRFVPVTPENTRMADGSPLPDELGSIGWKWLPDQGNGGVFESQLSDEKVGSTLMVTASGLEPGTAYEVFGYFWADGFEGAAWQSEACDPAQFGLTLAGLHPFSGKKVASEPWLVAPGSDVGKSYGYQSLVEEQQPLAVQRKLSVRDGGSRLVRARIGCSSAGTDGSLPVFVAPYISRLPLGSATVDGIALRLAPEGVAMDPGWKSGTRLHHAVRAGDPVTIGREIERGADLNAFDEENLTPLFYAVASGDFALAQKLLASGAKAELPGQSMSPLTAAAAISSTELTKLLLDAGAKVALSAPEDSGGLAIIQDPRVLHPVIAATRSGSVPVLRLLLAQAPGLKIQELIAEPQDFKAQRRKYNETFDPDLVDESIKRQDWEMAAFLIRHGCPPVESWRYEHKNSGVLALSRLIERSSPESLPVVEAMLDAGIPAYYESKTPFPRDGLRAAAYTGKVDLVRRLLPLARSASAAYQAHLLELAMQSENPEAVRLVKEYFPQAKPLELMPYEKQQVPGLVQYEDSRLFLPRTSPPTRGHVIGESGKHVMAVIAAPEAAGPAEVLAAAASKIKGWKVVDRSLTESALLEAKIAKPWLDGEYRLAGLGDMLEADCLVIASAAAAGKATVYRFELVEVATGLEIHREHFISSAFSPEADLAGFLRRAGEVLDLAAGSERHQAITLLSFEVSDRTPHALALSQLMRATVQREIDATPGLISLSRAQSARLVEEQALQGKNSVWGASHLIEGSLTPHGKDQIKVALRLQTMRGGEKTMTDVERVGNQDSPSRLVAEAWGEMLEKAAGMLAAPMQARNDRRNAESEAKRLLREVEWLLAMAEKPEEILPMMESALALGAPMDKLIPLHLECLLRQIHSFSPGWKPVDQGKVRYKLADLRNILPLPRNRLKEAGQSLHDLPRIRQLLHQASWYLERYGKDYLTPTDQDNGTEFWATIEILSFIRATIPESRLRPEQRSEFSTFAEELDDFTRLYFATLHEVEYPHEKHYALTKQDDLLLRKNPELLNGVAGMVMTSASTRLILRYLNSDEALGQHRLASKMVELIGEDPSPYLQYKKADLACLLANTEQRPQAIRRFIETAIELNTRKDADFGEIDYSPFCRPIIDLHTTSYYFHRFWPTFYVYHGSCALPSLLHTPRMAPDQLLKFTHYLFGYNQYRRRVVSKQDNGTAHGDPFRKDYNGYITKGFGGKFKGEIRRSRVRKERFEEIGKSTDVLELIVGRVKKPSADADAKSQAPMLTTELLLDLRGEQGAGVAIWPLVDSTDPNRLWIYYFPSVDNQIPVRLGTRGAQNCGYISKSPQLLAIDCRAGRVEHRIDLHTAMGAGLGEDLSGFTCEVWEPAFDQTRSHFMTNVSADSPSRRLSRTGALIINKETGSVHVLPKGVSAREGRYDIGFLRCAVAGVGDHFFFLDRGNEKNGGALAGIPTGGNSVFQVGPDFEIRPVTVIGRRPEKTPFDAVDRRPMSLTAHDGKLAVANESILSYYDPVTGTWSPEVEAKPDASHMFQIHEDHFWDHLRPLNEICLDGKSTGWTMISWSHASGTMRIASKDKGIRDFKIKAEIPEQFRLNTIAKERDGSDSSGKDKFKNLPVGDHPQFGTADLTVVAQSDEDMIFAIATGNKYEWHWPSRNDFLLPFLWKISKSDLLELLNN